MSGVYRIDAERQRQINSEGWTPEHDDGEDHGELLAAALCYGRAAMTSINPDSMHAAAPVGAPVDWPWMQDEYKPVWSDPIRNLERAGALIAAEIDRLERAS